MDDLTLAADLVRQAGTLAQRMRDAHGTIGVIAAKGHASEIVTAADRAAEALVADLLATQRPTDGLLGEEGAGLPSRSGRTWIVDPVDGTLNFVNRLPTWCTALVLRDDVTGVGLVAAVYSPDANTLWTGGEGLPCVVSAGGAEPRTPAPIGDVGVGEHLLATYLHSTTVGPLLTTWTRIAHGAQAIRILGSGSVDLAYVAESRLGAFCQPDVKPWDWLPGATLVRSAGGAAEVVEHAGHRWHLAGSGRAVADLAALVRAV